MKRSTLIVGWAITATLLLVISTGWPDAPRRVVEGVSRTFHTPVARAQTADAPAQLEWLSWMFYRLTSPRGKVILFSPWLNDPRGPFSNRESPVTLDNLELAHLILVPGGHGDDQGHTVDVARKTGAMVVTTFELANSIVARGVESGKILRGQPGSRFEVEGIKIQVVNSVHGSGAAPLPGQPATVYGGPALGSSLPWRTG